MKPLTKRELLRLCVLLRRYAAEVRIRRGLSEANLAKTIVGYIEEYLHGGCSPKKKKILKKRNQSGALS